ncbi:MAG: hypothetical protein QXH03_07955 [Candidatus Bathyarchaeia archaeon]
MKSLEGLPSEMKFLMAVDMTDFALQVCVAGIKAENPEVGEAELLEKLRERLEWCRRERQRQRGV